MEGLPDSPLVDQARSLRPVFSGLRVEEEGETSGVEVTLVFGRRELTGYARGVEGGVAHPVAAAIATLDALRKLVGPGIELELVWVQAGEAPAADRPPLAQVLVQCRRGEEDELYVGSALVRGDEAVATVRAVLDALNRPLQRLLAGDGD